MAPPPNRSALSSGPVLCKGFGAEVSLRIDPGEDFVEQFVDGLTAMVAGLGFMQAPPNAFDRVGLRCILGKVMHTNALTPLPQVFLHALALMKRGVVTDYVRCQRL